MTSPIGQFVAVCALTVAASPASAGLRSPVPVSVYIGGAQQIANASGSLGTASNSADRKPYIGCTIIARPGSATSAICEASDANGQTLSCTTTKPDYVALAKSLREDSYLTFERLWGASDECLAMGVQNKSWLDNKTPWPAFSEGRTSGAGR
ncbi:hypothetical protein [Luteimonas aquatica]|uniref:hypothetical protein n=1 Tax=Luteimonas aquatica TaxID=450364 RepID=UPI001F593CA8|nr:hypothetical protein [Luteimonas aquatica]